MATLVHHASFARSHPLPTGFDEEREDHSLVARGLALVKMGAWSCALETETLTWTSGVYDLFGLPPGTPLDRRAIVELYADESREAMERLRARTIARGGTFSLDAQIRTIDGEPRWMRLSAEMIRMPGHPPRLHGMKQDITEERQRWEAIRQLAESDALTGLANRAVYQSRFLDRAPGAPGIGPLGALLLFDLDGFKAINDRFGHAAGDACLKVFAQRLSSSFPDALLTARIGGDEFAMLVGDETSLDALHARLATFLSRLGAPIPWNGHLFDIATSIGIAVPEDPLRFDAEELSAIADANLYVAKRKRQGRRAA